MKKNICDLLAAFVVAGCQTPLPPAGARNGETQTPSHEELVGGYVHGGRLLYLTLRKDGTYGIGLGDCTGGGGIAEGTWNVAGNHITFSPTNETMQIKGLLREADVVRDGQYWALVRPADRELVKSKGISFDTCLKNTAVLK
jgi:hypothetical protein